MEERRAVDKLWKQNLECRVVAIEKAIDRNNEMTETLLQLFDGMKSFWNFCSRASKVIIWIVKKGTIIAVAVTAAYHAVDAIAGHDVALLWKALWNKK